MCRGMVRRSCGFVSVVAWLTVCSAALAAEKDQPPRPVLRELKGQELRDAREARDRADVLRAAYERPRQGPHGAAKDEAEFAKVAAAYRDAIAKCKGTEIAAYCLVRLAGAHMFSKEYDKAAEVLNELASGYPGTEHEAEAYFTFGLMHLQNRHDPAAALPWFGKVQPPPTADDDGTVPDRKYSKADVRYISAQQCLAKCEIRLGDPAGAAQRVEALGRRYPQYRASFEKSLRFEVRSALSDSRLKDLKPVLEDWLKRNPE